MIAALLGYWLAMLIAGQTEVGRTMRRWTVEKPAIRLARITRGHVLLATVLVLGLFAIGYFLEGDGLILSAMMMPELIGWATMFEISAYLDAAIGLIAVASAMRGTGFRTAIVSRLRRPNSRTVRARRVRRPRPQSENDDEDPARIAAAA